MISRLVGLVLTLLVALAPARASTLEPRRPGQASFLSRATFADGRLWLLSDAGELSSITEGKDERVMEPLPEPALDLCAQNGHPVVITCKRKDCPRWTVRRWNAGTWSAGPTIQKKRDDLIALSCTPETLILLTTRRLVDVGGEKQSSVALSEKLNLWVASVYVTPHQVFVGFNAGEWGGGLRRIDRRSGMVTVIEKSATGALCRGPLNTDLDPVHGIASEPWKPDCVAVAIGLVHMMPHGRIVEVCGDKVQRLYVKEQRSVGSNEKCDEPFPSVAFFGLARAGDALWAVGTDGMYRIEAGGAARFTPLPGFKKIGGIDVSFDLPNLILVLTNINQRRSLSGSVPILVPR